ncbi:MAG TPA: hypothetical protein VME45_22725 [Stellaceae bacterium]|nr:hypothetical protein [Stellaceae bacterium]
MILALSAKAAIAQQYPGSGGPVVTAAPPPPSTTPAPGLAPPPTPAYPLPAAMAPVLVPPPATLPGSPSFLSGLQVIGYPYLWLAGLNMAIETPLARAPEVNISAGAGEILGNISYMPFMGSTELRYGPFGVLADGLHVPLVVPITTRNIFFRGGSSAAMLNVATGDALYRLLDQPGQTVDAGLGFRFWDASTVTTLYGRFLVPTQQVNDSGSWTDPLIAVRYHRALGYGFGLTAYGDVGGFGIAAHSDWEITSLLDYVWNPQLTFQVGYRSLNLAYSASSRPLGFNVHMKGPLLGLTLRF